MAVRTDITGKLFREHGPFVLRLCRLLLRDPHEAEDAAQQVFLRAYRAVGAGAHPIRPRAWLAEIARNECRARARAAAARHEAPLTEALPAYGLDPVDAAAVDAVIASLREELGELPDRQREALLLREVRGLSYGEVAAQLDVTEHAVESLLQRARRRLASRLGDARRTLAGAALAADSVRAALGRLLAPGAAEVATGAGAAAGVAKVAATGAVAVAVGVSAGDRGRVAPPTPEQRLVTSSTQHRTVPSLRAPAAATRRPPPDEKRLHEGGDRSGSSSGSLLEDRSGSSGPGGGDSGQTEVSPAEDNSGPGSLSSGSGSGSSGASSSGPSDGSDSSGSGSGSNGSGSDHSSDNSGPGSSEPDD